MIGEMALADLVPGALAARFAAGEAVVLVQCAELIAALWHGLLEDTAEQLPWQAPLIDIARNHYGSGDITVSLGDLFYFQPGQHGYIARKIALRRSGDGDALVAEPDSFVQGATRFATRDDVLDLCWTVGERLMTAVAPDGNAPGDYSIAVQRLKYQQTRQDFDQLGQLARNSLGRWGRAGFALDERRIEAAGPLRRKGVSDLYGLTVQVPILRGAARLANGLFSRRDVRGQIDADQRLIEGAHYDYRYFSALCGCRSGLVTQIFVQKAWHDLPIGMDTLVVMPGSIAASRFGLPQILHRVVHVEKDGADAEPDAGDPRTGNVTLLIGAA